MARKIIGTAIVVAFFTMLVVMSGSVCLAGQKVTGDLEVTGKIQSIGEAGATHQSKFGDPDDFVLIGSNGNDPQMDFYETNAYKGSFKVNSGDMYFINRLTGDDDDLIFRTKANQNSLVVKGSGDVIALGSITGSNISGTNTGDQDLSGFLALDGSNSSSYSGSVTRDVDGYIASVARAGGLTYTVTRTDGLISSFTDGAKTWTITRNANGYITEWSVA